METFGHSDVYVSLIFCTHQKLSSDVQGVVQHLGVVSWWSELWSAAGLGASDGGIVDTVDTVQYEPHH